MSAHYQHPGPEFRSSRELSEDLEYQMRSHGNFASRTLQEIRRAERYRHFLSLVVVRLVPAHDSNGTSGVSGEELSDRFSLLRDTLRYESRVSDLVSGVDNGLFGILLVETGRDGTRGFLERIDDHLTALRAGSSIPYSDLVSIECNTFPNTARDDSSLVEMLARCFPTPQ